MKSVLRRIVGTLLLIAAVSPALAGDVENRLRQALWKNRVLLVFSQAPEGQAEAVFQEQLIRYQKEIRERDLMVVRNDPQDSEALRKRFQVKTSGFAVVLIGKDGGGKETQTRPDLPAFLRLIDSMPMRQQEMK